MDLHGKTALVTGGARGLGRASALALAEAGADVVITYKTSRREALTALEEIHALGGRGALYELDVRERTQVAEVHQAVSAVIGPVHILVNNAGRVYRPGAWDNISEHDLVATVDTNLLGAIRCIQEFSSDMLTAREGRIINVSSTYALTGAASILAYTAAKAGLISLTYSLARELGEKGVLVNCIAPGNFNTQMAAEAGSDFAEWAVSTTPVGRLGEPNELGDCVVFLAKSDFLNGSVLVLDGGQILNM